MCGTHEFSRGGDGLAPILRHTGQTSISEDLLRRVDTHRSGIQGQQNAERHPVDEYQTRKGDCCLVVRDAYRWAERRSCAPRSVTKLCAQDLLTLSLSSARPIRGGRPRPARVGAVPTALRLRRLTSTSSPLPSMRARPSRSMVVRPLRWSVQRVNNIGAGILQQEVYADPRNDVLT
ncbi:hypothetical protein PC128_g18252 [Phytophthora cactorum]|nr:hypothetical protein PC128_g18252 [Phytophthora cactorum]